jgi:type II secretion system protein C
MRYYQIARCIKIINVFLLLAIAFFGFHIVEKNFGARLEPVSVESSASHDNVSVKHTSKSSNPTLPGYKAVWKRNLFNVSQNSISPADKQNNFDDIAEADEKIGLKLVGTVAGKVPMNRYAIIENSRNQAIYREGDTTGNFVIKKILRSNVIIASLNGDKLLALKSDVLDLGEIVMASSSQTPSKSLRHNRSGGRYKTVELPREEIMVAFDDIDRLIREVGTSAYKFGKLTGFKIDSVPEKSILKKIGLRSHDKILALNDTSIEDETGAFKFFEQIAEGKKVTIKYRRRNRTRRIELNPI